MDWERLTAYFPRTFVCGVVLPLFCWAFWLSAIFLMYFNALFFLLQFTPICWLRSAIFFLIPSCVLFSCKIFGVVSSCFNFCTWWWIPNKHQSAEQLVGTHWNISCERSSVASHVSTAFANQIIIFECRKCCRRSTNRSYQLMQLSHQVIRWWVSHSWWSIDELKQK